MNYGTKVILFMVCFLTGCSRNIMVNPENADIHLLRIKQNGQKYSGTVLFHNGKLVSMKEFWASGDSVYFKDKNSDKNMKASMKDIDAIKFIMHGKGAMDGLCLGILVGGVSGFGIGLSAGDDPPSSGFQIMRLTAEEKGMISGVALGLVGGFVGIIGGAAVGSKENYVMSHPENVKSEKENSRIIPEKAKESANFYRLDGVEILKETENEIKIKWRGRKATLPRGEIRMVNEEGQLILVVPENLYNRKLR